MSVVMKFGGTSVADPDAINRLIGIVRQQQAKTKSAPVVVVSALAKVTDSLVAIAQLAEDGASDQAAAGVKALLDRHLAVAAAVTSTRRAKVLEDVKREFDGWIATKLGPINAMLTARNAAKIEVPSP